MEKTGQPVLIILAGCNGAGKSSAAPSVLADTVGLYDFVNADVIGQGLSGFAPDDAALVAARIMLERLEELALARRSFAFETTLASRSLAPRITQLRSAGYQRLPSDVVTIAAFAISWNCIAGSSRGGACTIALTADRN